MKKKVLTVQDNRQFSESTPFEVVKLQNSTQFRIGQVLSESDVRLKCTERDWTVNVIAPKTR